MKPSDLPPCVQDYLEQLIRKMRYRRRIRAEVRAELAAHFEDELRDCADAQEREQRARRLVEGFGDARLLAILCRRSKRRCRPLWVTAGVRTLQAAGVLVVTLGLYLAWFVHGRPVVKVDYLAVMNRMSRPPIADRDNAWPQYREAMALLVAPGSELGQMPAFRNPDGAEYRDFAALPPKTRDAIAKWLEANRPAWEHFVVAAAKPYLAVLYRNHQDVQDPWLLRVRLPDLSAVEQLSRVGIWLARIDLERGRTAEALEECLAVVRAGGHWQRSGTPLEQLKGLRISRLGHEAILRIVAEGDLNASELADVQQKVASIYSGDYPLIDAQFERLVALDVIQHVFTNEGPGGGHLVPSISDSFIKQALAESCPRVAGVPLLRTALSALHAGRARTVKTVERVFDHYRELAFLSPYQRRARGVVTIKEMVESLPARRYALVRDLVPALDQTVETRFRGRTLHEATLTILALQRYRAERGAYPPSLDELVRSGCLDVSPNVLPMDPYCDRPLSYRLVGGSFVLYSVGPDFEDNGGESGRGRDGRPRMWASSGDTIFWPWP